MVLARRLGSPSALRAPSVFLPDPHSSEIAKSRLRWAKGLLDRHRCRAALAVVPCADFLKAANGLLRNAGSGRRIDRYMAPW